MIVCVDEAWGLPDVGPAQHGQVARLPANLCTHKLYTAYTGCTVRLDEYNNFFSLMA